MLFRQFLYSTGCMSEMRGFLSSFWQRLLRDLGMQDDARQMYEFDELLIQSVQELAEREQRSEDEVTSELLSVALTQRGVAEANLGIWGTLSPREQQVAALASMGLTNRQIARRLVISPETVKSHMRNILRKFGLHSKVELQQALEEWDFSSWLGL